MKDISYNGNDTLKFEKALSKYTGAKYVAATNTGTAALHLALLSIGIKPKDRVITQAFTFVATANAIRYCGAEPIFVDVDMNGCMNPYDLEKALKRYKNIKAIIPVHLYGHMCDMDMIMKVAKDIPVIEDAAQGLGVWHNIYKHAGTFGKCGVISFNSGKLICTGGGGALLTNDKSIYEKVILLSTTAKDYKNKIYRHSEVGYNYRMPALNAKEGMRHVKKIDKLIKKKKAIWREPYQLLTDMPMYKDCKHTKLPVSTYLSREGKGVAYVQ